MKRLQTILTVLVLVAAVALALYITFYDPTPEPASAPAPAASATAPSGAAANGPSVRLVTWNLYNLGRTKNDTEIAFMAEQLRDFDIVAIQEIVTSPPGAQAVARLDAALDRMGFQWDYRLSDPTTGDGTERYAFLWKPSRVRLVGQAWLEPSLAAPIDREPYLARFEQRSSGQRVLVANLHAVPTSKDPEREIALLDTLHDQYPDDHVIILGDFNLDEDDAAWDELRALGYAQVLDDQPTSLRRKRRDEPNGHLANEYDNIFYEAAVLQATRAGIVDFTTSFETLREARRISDHLPVFMDVQWTPSAVPVQ
jgi:endonuclease/exonuclease/phosphatase family metal-dependent hydrolase